MKANILLSLYVVVGMNQINLMVKRLIVTQPIDMPYCQSFIGNKSASSGFASVIKNEKFIGVVNIPVFIVGTILSDHRKYRH